jgi:DNA-binding NtrC family response regulator
MDVILDFDWPGNIRQLLNVLERATAFTDKAVLEEHDFQHLLRARSEGRTASAIGENRRLTLQEVERNVFMETYLRTGKNKAKTARELGISERSVYNLLRRHDST